MLLSVADLVLITPVGYCRYMEHRQGQRHNQLTSHQMVD